MNYGFAFLYALIIGISLGSYMYKVIYWPYTSKKDFCGYIEFYVANTYENNNNSDYADYIKYFEENPDKSINKSAKDKHKKSFICFKSLRNIWFWVFSNSITFIIFSLSFIIDLYCEKRKNKVEFPFSIFFGLICFIIHLVGVIYIAEGKIFFEKAAKNGGKFYEEGDEKFKTSLASEIISLIMGFGYLIFRLILYRKDFLISLCDCCKCLYDCLSDCCGSLWESLSNCFRSFGECLSNCCGSLRKHLKECCPGKKQKIPKKKEIIKYPKIFTLTEKPISTNDEFLESFSPDKSMSKEKKLIIMFTNIRKDYISNILEDISEIKIYDLALQEERIEKIKNITNRILNENLSLTDYLKNVLELGSNIKYAIIFDIFNNKNNFYSNEELKNATENSNLFLQNAFSTFLSQGNVICAIEKKATNEIETEAILKLISNAFIFQKVINFSYNLGEDKNRKLLNDLDSQNTFISEKKAFYSKLFKCEPNDIIITNFKLKSSNINFDVIKIGGIPTLNTIEDQDLINYTYKNLLEACRINPSLFDNNYNNIQSGWGTGQKRGPPHHLMEYDPPLEFIGLGLNVLNKYDGGKNIWLGMENVEGEWYIAYHGTRIEFVKDIIDKGFGAGSGQAYEFDDNINELSKPQYIKCGRGVYCTPKIKEAEGYAGVFTMNNSQYKIVFMCRVNPYKIRIAKGMPIYWIVSGDSLSSGNIKKYDDEIRIYRILLKKFN